MRSRKVPREDRRRRVLLDDATGKKSSVSRTRKDHGGRLQLYVEDAVASAQPRITDFVPRRKYVMLVWLLLCLIPPAMIQTLYVLRDEYFRGSLFQDTSALRLVGSGTIATWFSSMLLMLAGLVAIMIYCVRRHKLDDYRARYRLWLWASAFCAFCSLDTVAALHRPIRTAMIYVTGSHLWRDGSVWWMIVLGTVGALVLLRVVMDTWRSRGTLLYLTLSMACYLGAALFYLRVARIGPGQVDMMAYVGLLMTAHVFLVFSLLVYARFVCREAAGEIIASTQKKRSNRSESGRSWFSRKKEPASSSEKNKKRRAAAGKSTGNPATAGKTVPGIAHEAADDYEDVEPDDMDELELLTDPKLSKTEIRKVRKKKRQQRRAA